MTSASTVAVVCGARARAAVPVTVMNPAASSAGMNRNDLMTPPRLSVFVSIDPRNTREPVCTVEQVAAETPRPVKHGACSSVIGRMGRPGVNGLLETGLDTGRGDAEAQKSPRQTTPRQRGHRGQMASRRTPDLHVSPLKLRSRLT